MDKDVSLFIFSEVKYVYLFNYFKKRTNMVLLRSLKRFLKKRYQEMGREIFAFRFWKFKLDVSSSN